ncbi:MAG TPA: ABC transporter permease, partial [Bryobacteraceae bacterium]|nr:ABC transporter permease [Bryobacteraceae bacterium]
MTIWTTALKIASREARASALKFLFVAFGVAAGVGALTGVRGFSQAFHDTLRREARTLMAADISIRQFNPPTPGQEAAIDRYTAQGAVVTRIVETVSMMDREGSAAPPLLVSIKAVDPRAYPFYGKFELEPPAKLRDALTADTIAVSDDLAVRMDLSAGSVVRLGGQPFRVAGVVKSEPDRMTGSLNIGPRVLITRDGLDRTGLMQFGSRASYRLLFRSPEPQFNLDAMKADLNKVFTSARVATAREAHPAIERALERSTQFLSLVSLIALIVGALGVATSVHAHLQQRLDTIAIMKCLGARSSQIIGIYTIQTSLLALAGGLAGVAVGAGVQMLFPVLLERYLKFETGVAWSPAFALEGIVTGLLVTLLFTLPPLLSIRRVKPALIFRREMAEVRPPVLTRLKRQIPSILCGALILLGLGAIAGWLAESARMGWMFVGGLVT